MLQKESHTYELFLLTKETLFSFLEFIESLKVHIGFNNASAIFKNFSSVNK